MTILIFLTFVGFVIGLSFYLGNRTKTSSGYYAAGGQVSWPVNGIAFAGDYLSAASFLGICGMIATMGYDGFLYSIGYLAGWVVALLVVAEPLKRLGKYTFADALDAKFDSKGIKLAAGISTLVVSVFYLIPQMVGAGVLVQPLLGIAQHWGVILVGAVVIIIVASAGMASTTFVQFFKGGMLILFSIWLVIALCARGFDTQPDQGGKQPFYAYASMSATEEGGTLSVMEPGFVYVETRTAAQGALEFAKLSQDGMETWWRVLRKEGAITLEETQSAVTTAAGQKLINGAPESAENQIRQVGHLESLMGEAPVQTGAVNPVEFLAKVSHEDTIVRRWKDARFEDGAGNSVIVYYSIATPGDEFMKPGLMLKVQGTWLERLDFFSLMLTLFLGTAALPHILIRYYTVANPASARKSTLVAIGAIGFFYIMTMYMGLGAIVNGVLNPADSNMAAPLLARSFGEFLFAIISAIAFATVLGTVSGLIIAASGAVAHDLMDRYMDMKMDDKAKIRAGKISAFVVGFIAIVLGILFQGVNVGFLVGLAFAVAASANLPSILMLLFWKRTTSKGITASIIMGVVSSLGLIAISPEMYKLYGIDPTLAPLPINNPGIISIPLSFLTLVVVSLLTQPDAVELDHA